MDSNFGKLELGKTKLSKWVNKFEEVFESETRGGVDDGRLAFWKFDLEAPNFWKYQPKVDEPLAEEWEEKIEGPTHGNKKFVKETQKHKGRQE